MSKKEDLDFSLKKIRSDISSKRVQLKRVQEELDYLYRKEEKLLEKKTQRDSSC